MPLFSAGKIVGTLNAVMHGSGRARLAPSDVPFFEELGRRIAPAIGTQELCHNGTIMRGLTGGISRLFAMSYKDCEIDSHYHYTIVSHSS